MDSMKTHTVNVYWMIVVFWERHTKCNDISEECICDNGMTIFPGKGSLYRGVVAGRVN